VRVPTIDTLVCVAWPAGLRRRAAALEVGDVVEVSGSLRQRYWRAGAALAGRTEVEATAVRRLVRAPA
jgi:single-strand DNA-binding protein